MEIPIDHRWFLAIVNREKIIEGKKNSPTWSKLTRHQIIRFIDNETNQQCPAIVTNLTPYHSINPNDQLFALRDFLLKEGLKRTLPGVETLDEAIAVYTTYYLAEDIFEHGMLAIEFMLL